MYGPPPVMSPVPPGRRVGVARIALWVLIAVVLVGGVGLFAFIPLTVLAVRSRSRRDALLAGASLVFSVLGAGVSGQYPDAAHQPWWFGLLACGMLAHGIASTAWFITCDLRRARGWARVQEQGRAQVQAQGHAAARQPWPGLPPQAQPSGSAATPTVAMPFAPIPVQPDRLGQVRAELDELSDYLRKEQGS